MDQSRKIKPIEDQFAELQEEYGEEKKRFVDELNGLAEVIGIDNIHAAGSLLEAVKQLKVAQSDHGKSAPVVAWMQYRDHNGTRPTTIHLCDSDAKGAFEVIRKPTDTPPQ